MTTVSVKPTVKRSLRRFRTGQTRDQRSNHRQHVGLATSRSCSPQKSQGWLWRNVAATVIHYINDVIIDMGNFSDGSFADASSFKDLGKHWSEMMGSL